MSAETDPAPLDADEPVEEAPGRRSRTPLVLVAVMAIILGTGTWQVLSSNAEREDQARKVREAQSRLDGV